MPKGLRVRVPFCAYLIKKTKRLCLVFLLNIKTESRQTDPAGRHLGTRKAERCFCLRGTAPKGKKHEPGAKAHSCACRKIPSGILPEGEALLL